ncbi:MAG: LysR substrate-binding domain-containing protein [Tabrizicola sp.]|uniref:LysR family transcriptional regulator n=1 Tax=Tabrizicola sp. TaxID=2005166 RepID=UPI002ABB5C46|nr:LysR substrate-binding domain-containing protein [Tabrizicola sp.]MDZ4085557.1 LysR substrate-binding domain-containing protein [Tabrizicola sp.]
MRWRDLPSLSALRAFDATARSGSFAEAGRLLNVTHAAVTQAVRGLEADLGVALVRRAGRTVALTAAGEQLARALDDGFGTVAAGIASLREAEARRVVRITTTTFIAETHVMPRLPEFWARHPGVEVALSPSPAKLDLAREGFDMAIRALPEGWVEAPEEEIRPLCRSQVIAVCAPALAASGLHPQDMPWVIGADKHWELAEVAGTGLDVSRLKRVEVGSPHLEMSACRQGLGAGTATEIICRADLEAGRLVRLPLGGLPVVTYAVVLPRGRRRPAVEAFAGWLATIF